MIIKVDLVMSPDSTTISLIDGRKKVCCEGSPLATLMACQENFNLLAFSSVERLPALKLLGL